MAFFTHCGVRYLDHLAVTTPVFAQTLADYLDLPGTRLLRGPGWNPAQQVRYAFVQLVDGCTVEILGVEGESPIARHVAQGGGAYHLCHAVADLDAALDAARGAGAALVGAPTPDVAFDGRRVAFLFHPAHGLLEFVEAYPAAVGIAAPSPPSSPAAAPAAAGDLAHRLAGALRRVFPALREGEEPQACLEVTEGWDSLGQIRLIMEVEQEFGIQIPAAEVAVANDYASLLHLVAGKV